MSRRQVPSQILKLDGGNASAIAKRLGRTESTITRWKREGIPKGARDDCIAALKRHENALKAVASRKYLAALRKEHPQPVELPKKQKIPSKYKPSPIGRESLSTKRTKVLSGPNVVPLTERERGERAAQRALIRLMKDQLDAVVTAHVVRANIEGLEYLNAKRYREDRSVLADMIRNDDPRWTEFQKLCEKLLLAPREIRNAWFSPKALAVRH
jgi:hypothetical protein